MAQQQCVGYQHIPLADYALIALNYFTWHGSVTSIGEQPLKGLIKPEANGRLSVAEALTNMMFCVITELADVKCSGNWMWPAKLEGKSSESHKHQVSNRFVFRRRSQNCGNLSGDVYYNEPTQHCH